eukprot:13179399-Ditylum_brightwellii.AAC.1
MRSLSCHLIWNGIIDEVQHLFAKLSILCFRTTNAAPDKSANGTSILAAKANLKGIWRFADMISALEEFVYDWHL